MPGNESNYKRRRALLAYQRRHRRGATGDTMTAADQLELENTIQDSLIAELLKRSVPLMAWFVWILLGSLFYIYYEEYDWMRGIYLSVDIGCGIGWSPPYDTPRHHDAISKLFSSIHVTIGQIFVGIAVLYIAEQLVQDKESWMISILQKRKQDTYSKSLREKLVAKLVKFKIIFLLLLWIALGVIFGSTCIHEWGPAESADFVLATLAKGGFRRIPNHSESWKFLFVAFYTFFGVPLTVISLGMIVSFTLAGSEERALYENIMVAVTPQELEVMKSVGIGVQENVILKQDFIVLMIVRIGAAFPEMIIRINERFKSLDRKKLGKISYDDIIFRGNDIKKSKSETIRKIMTRRASSPEFQRIKPPSKIILKSASLGSFRGSFTRDANGRSPSRVFPTLSIGKFRSSSRNLGSEKNDDIQQEESDLDGCEDDIQSPSFVSANMTKYQFSFSDSSSKQLSFQDMNEMVPSRTQHVDGEVTPFLTPDDRDHQEAREEEKISLNHCPEIETTTSPSDQLLGIEEHQDEELDSSSSQSSESEYPDLAIQPCQDSSNTLGKDLDDHHDNQTPEHSSRDGDQYPDDNSPHNLPSSAHFRSRRKPVRISRALRHQLEIKKEKEILSNLHITDKNLFQKIREYVMLRIRHSHFLFVAAWFVWLCGGALFYTFYCHLTFYRGFNLSVSVGYALFWDEPEYDSISKAFSVFHQIVGTILVACGMAIIARNVVESKKLWYVEALRKQAILDAAQTEEVWDDIIAICKYWIPKLRIPFLFLSWEALGIAWTCIFVKWSFFDGLYFVSSGLATGGMYPIPADSPSWYFLFVGIYVTLGAPIMAIALGQFADHLINMGPNHDLEEKMKTRITDEELDTMKACGMENGDGFIDASEFVILILVRIHAINPELISVIEERFAELDADNSGNLSYEELTLRTTQILASNNPRLTLTNEIYKVDEGV